MRDAKLAANANWSRCGVAVGRSRISRYRQEIINRKAETTLARLVGDAHLINFSFRIYL